MKLLKAIIPAVILKKLYSMKYKNQSIASVITDEDLDRAQDNKDDNN